MIFRKIKYLFLILLFIVVAGVAAVSFIVEKNLQKPSKLNQNTIIKVESTGGVQAVADILIQNKLIENKNMYIYATKIFRKKIKPGYYEVPAGSSTALIINLLDSGDVKVVKMTIPEGWRMEQVGRKLDEEKVLSYADFIAEAKNSEGKLFPDTYYLNPRMEAKEVVKMMTDDYEARTAGLQVTEGDLALASIVEKEAANDIDRGIIAGIYDNRIKAKVKLQSDPTVTYGRDTINIADLSVSEQIDYVFWKAAKTSEFTSVKSPYNTYQISGLPPAPICNPGLKSIEAAINPTANNFYYFLYGTDGLLHTSKTLAQHQAAVNQYMN